MTLKNSSHLPSTWRMIQSEMEMKLPASDQSLSMNFGKWDDQPHQHLPIARMLAGPWGGVLVADEVGLGKTISNNDYLMIKGSNATGLNNFSKKIIKGT